MNEEIDFSPDAHAAHYIPVPEGWTNPKGWTTFDEMRWLRDYHSREPEKCRAVCRMYLAGGRRWDRNIEVPRIMEQCAALVYGAVR